MSDAKTGNARDEAQKQKAQMPTGSSATILSPEVCKLYLAQSGNNYRSKRVVRAVKMVGAFSLDNQAGSSAAGNYLVEDNGLRIYSPEAFKDLYAPFRKLREKKE